MSQVTRDDPAADGRLIWITGIFGAGKTTIGRAHYARLKPAMPSLIYMHGDEI